ncbi:hypothetical protein [Microcoleus sp. FACHB-672]|uniref:hypothetical protein n=1 Tax=Microcoleus sp. FACHB-672 TaxID=2692825 RepID=UPI001688E334|nr:hypothetical protein [Microcoleus sp. FACHB-672]MBD2039908.1 hypothetical protein [Microcoleus sp. FACHB-672]
MQDTCSLGVVSHFKVKPSQDVKGGTGFLFHRQRQIRVEVPAAAFQVPKLLNLRLDILCGIALFIVIRWAIRPSPLPKFQGDDLNDLYLIDDR